MSQAGCAKILGYIRGRQTHPEPMLHWAQPSVKEKSACPSPTGLQVPPPTALTTSRYPYWVNICRGRKNNSEEGFQRVRTLEAIL